MPLFDQMYFDQKWSLFDTFRAFGRNLRAYMITAAYRVGGIVTTQNRRGELVTTQKRRGEIITGV